MFLSQVINRPSLSARTATHYPKLWPSILTSWLNWWFLSLLSNARNVSCSNNFHVQLRIHGGSHHRSKHAKHNQIQKKILLADHPTHKKYMPSNIQLNLLIPIHTNSKTTQLSSFRLGDLFISVFQLAFGYLQSKLPGFIEAFLGTLQILFLLLTSRTQFCRSWDWGKKNPSWRSPSTGDLHKWKWLLKWLGWIVIPWLVFEDDIWLPKKDTRMVLSSLRSLSQMSGVIRIPKKHHMIHSLKLRLRICQEAIQKGN